MGNGNISALVVLSSPLELAKGFTPPKYSLLRARDEADGADEKTWDKMVRWKCINDKNEESAVGYRRCVERRFEMDRQ